MLALILIEIKAKQVDKTFKYNIPSNLEEKIKIGIRVLVPFGKQKLEGFVLETKENEEVTYEIKDIIEVIDEEPVLNQELIELGKIMAAKTYSTLISIYQTMLPKAYKASNKTNINKKYITSVCINKDCDNLTTKQQAIIDLIKTKKVTKQEAKNISLCAYKKLIENEIIKEIDEETYRLDNSKNIIDKKITLNEEQEASVLEVTNNLNTYTPYLLFGVTGSGKTEVYMHIIDIVLKNNKEALILVPEISLTPQLTDTFKARFGSNIAIMHSRLSDGERYDEYRKILRKEVKIVIGARSAIFAPLTNLGIIIIDEEHSLTYKQENNPMYNAIDIALYRAKNYNIPVILGSATPSIESYTKAKLNNYKLLTLKNRVNKSLPKIELIDMKESIKKGNKIISQELFNKIEERLSKKEQIILLLNRRGYATITSCNECGYVDKCPNCDIPLIYHKTSNTMRCHYCGYGTKVLYICPECKSKDIKQLGMGTQKLEEEISKMFKEAKIIRMDVDTTSKKGAHEKIIDEFRNKQFDILIGTQMISKGLDFDDVTLVGVLNGDASLNIPDFRSAERTFQLLSQVSGRSGRSNKKGEVIIQTFNTDHYSIINTIKNDYETFYNEEMDIRKKLKYPPYYNLVLIKIKGKEYNNVIEESKKIKDYLTTNIKYPILGPTSANILKINNIFALQIIIKYKKLNEINEYLNFIYNKYKLDNKVTIDIDINPIKI